jgi:outer membrane cobalamin receptor
MNERTALSGYVDLRARISYAITPKLDVALRAENILSSTIVLWDGYRERGFFASAGFTWRF